MSLNRKAVAQSALVVIIIVLIIAIVVHYAGRECSKDTDCGDGFYCGSDNKCHEFKIIQKTEIHYDLLVPSIIIGIALVIAAYVLRGRQRQQRNTLR
jgi:hypothetical protein